MSTRSLQSQSRGKKLMVEEWSQWLVEEGGSIACFGNSITTITNACIRQPEKLQEFGKGAWARGPDLRTLLVSLIVVALILLTICFSKETDVMSIRRNGRRGRFRPVIRYLTFSLEVLKNVSTTNSSTKQKKQTHRRKSFSWRNSLALSHLLIRKSIASIGQGHSWTCPWPGTTNVSPSCPIPP